ncbi:MAG: asparagine synthase (glutamine-hydrolyzing) [Bacteroidota bacterium]
MCGIVGFKNFSSSTVDLKDYLKSAVKSMMFRGPDHQDTYLKNKIGLGHTRLSIIDTSSNAHQPMTDESGRYVLIFNGEIYNYIALKKNINNVDWKSTSDTEVLLHLLIQQGKDCLDKLNGFFAFAFYDNKEDYLLIVRDRMGIKPLHYFLSDDFFAFGSEIKALLSFPIPRRINQEALYWYLRLTYLPHDLSIIDGVKKLLPGAYLEIYPDGFIKGNYFVLEKTNETLLNYEKAKAMTLSLLEQSVERRMIADVPLGAFLSGGTDSSAVVYIASQINSSLNTFSIGYRDHNFFDETYFAELVAKKFNTHHTTFSLTNEDLLDDIENAIDYMDEPFGDSSAIPTFILSKKVSQSMKVALSGDGADELFGGYYKHLAFSKASNYSFINLAFKSIGSTASLFPTSRSTKWGNMFRRMAKYSHLLKLSLDERYWMLASFNMDADKLLCSAIDNEAIDQLKSLIAPNQIQNLNCFLDHDLKMVLPGDMLAKVDLMSMANGLEVRVPFLDKDLVAFARRLPPNYKVQGNKRKSILQDALEHILPKELHHRPKKGFEVPMLSWLRNELREDLNRTVFNRDLLQSQRLFDAPAVISLKRQLHSSNPGDVHSALWTLYVFQKWYKKYIS